MKSHTVMKFFTQMRKYLFTIVLFIIFALSPVSSGDASLQALYSVKHPIIYVSDPSTLIIENLDTTQAQFSFALYDAVGAAVYTSGVGTLDPGIPKVINIQDISGLPSGHFSLVLSADRLIHSLVMIQPEGITGDNLGFYQGGALPGLQALLAPIYKGVNGLSSGIHIQNSSAAPVDVNIQFYSTGGQVVAQGSISALPANATGTIRTNDIGNIPAGYTGWAEVTASGNIYPVTVNASTQEFEFVEPIMLPNPPQDNASQSQLIVSLPRLFKAYDEGGGSRTSQVLLVNPADSEAQFVIKYTNSLNESTYSPLGTLPSKEMLLINLVDVAYLDSQEIYSAEISSDSIIVVNEVTYFDTANPLPVGAYGYGYYLPAIDQHLPRLVLNDDRFSVFSIQNTGVITATGSIAYNRLDGTSAGQTNFTIPTGGFLRWKTQDISLLGGNFEGGAIITSSQPVAVQVDEGVFTATLVSKLKLLIVPLNWQNTQETLDQEAQTQIDLFLNELPLNSCRDSVVVDTLSVTSQNFDDFTCSLSDCSVDTIRTFVRDELDIDPTGYDVIIGLAETSPCAPIMGCSNGTDTIWVTSQYDIVTAHELGHIYNLEDQYCSNQAGSTDERCNDGDSQGDGDASGDVNWLDARLPCDCPPDGSNDSGDSPCCNFGGNNCGDVNYGVCCLGNKNAAGGRSTMSYANAPGPRGFDIHDLDFLGNLPELSCDTQVTSFKTANGHLYTDGTQTIINVSLRLHTDDSVTEDIISVHYGLPTSTSILEGQGGDYDLRVVDTVGNIAWNQEFSVYFNYQGPMILGVDYSGINYDSVDVSYRIPYTSGMTSVELYHNGALIYSKAILPGLSVWLPQILVNP